MSNLARECEVTFLAARAAASKAVAARLILLLSSGLFSLRALGIHEPVTLLTVDAAPCAAFHLFNPVFTYYFLLVLYGRPSGR